MGTARYTEPNTILSNAWAKLYLRDLALFQQMHAVIQNGLTQSFLKEIVLVF